VTEWSGADTNAGKVAAPMWWAALYRDEVSSVSGPVKKNVRIQADCSHTLETKTVDLGLGGQQLSFLIGTMLRVVNRAHLAEWCGSAFRGY